MTRNKLASKDQRTQNPSLQVVPEASWSWHGIQGTDALLKWADSGPRREAGKIGNTTSRLFLLETGLVPPVGPNLF